MVFSRVRIPEHLACGKTFCFKQNLYNPVYLKGQKTTVNNHAKIESIQALKKMNI